MLGLKKRLSRVACPCDSFPPTVRTARVEGYLIRAGDFRDHVSALDGASDLFQLALGDAAHARLSGVASSPFDDPGELAVTPENTPALNSGMKQDNRDVICRAGGARLSVENNEWPARIEGARRSS